MKDRKIILGSYVNGNTSVKIYDDGTKIRTTEDDEFNSEFPESIDLKITNVCNRGCLFCHEDSKPNGEHAFLCRPEFLNTLRPYTELAIGGGDPLCHPDIEVFLKKMREQKVICNITVNQQHFMESYGRIRLWSENKMIYGIGVSLDYNNPVSSEFIGMIQSLPNAVIHIIEGVISREQMFALTNRRLKVLILGYKMLRRGMKYFDEKVLENKKWLKQTIPVYINSSMFQNISFDNLAIEHLEIKKILPEELWSEFYMGDDGQHTMYIDLVNKEYSKSSTSTLRFDITDDIIEMFSVVKSDKYDWGILMN
jgi:hypothetical protein